MLDTKRCIVSENSHCWMSVFDWNLCCLSKTKQTKKSSESIKNGRLKYFYSLCFISSSKCFRFVAKPEQKNIIELPQRFFTSCFLFLLPNLKLVSSFDATNDTFFKGRKSFSCCRGGLWGNKIKLTSRYWFNYTELVLTSGGNCGKCESKTGNCSMNFDFLKTF